jgi:hypothetical protein
MRLWVDMRDGPMEIGMPLALATTPLLGEDPRSGALFVLLGASPVQIEHTGSRLTSRHAGDKESPTHDDGHRSR